MQKTPVLLENRMATEGYWHHEVVLTGTLPMLVLRLLGEFKFAFFRIGCLVVINQKSRNTLPATFNSSAFGAILDPPATTLFETPLTTDLLLFL